MFKRNYCWQTLSWQTPSANVPNKPPSSTDSSQKTSDCTELPWMDISFLADDFLNLSENISGTFEDALWKKTHPDQNQM